MLPVFKLKVMPKLIASLALILACASVVAEQDSNQSKPNKTESKIELNLETIMSDPDWMGNSPKNPSWSLDGKTIGYRQKALGHSHRNDYQIDVKKLSTTKINGDALLQQASHAASLNEDKTKGVFTYQGNIYLIDVQRRSISPVTADERMQVFPVFTNNSKISYLVGKDIFSYDLKLKLEKQIASFKTEDDPDKNKDKNYLEQSQPRLFDYLAQQSKETEYQKNRAKANEHHSVKTWYLGKNNIIRTFRLSPNANWLLLGLTKKDRDGKADHMPRFVTEDGYVKDDEVRPLVGTSKPLRETFFLIDLVKSKKTALSLKKLPGIGDDPLELLRKNAAKKIGYQFKAKDKSRAVYAYNWDKNQGVEWSTDSRNAAIMLFSYDNKSRWIVTVNTKNKSLTTGHWMSDDAWTNDSAFNEFGWLPDNKTLYYLSEEDGYSHLYIKTGKRKPTQLTRGDFEVNQLTVSTDGKNIFYRANKNHPGIYEIYSINLEERNSRIITDLGGMNDYVLSPDNKNAIITHSDLTHMPELYLQSTIKGSKAVRLTDTMSDGFKSINWSSHVKQPIYSRLYMPSNTRSGVSAAVAKKPAVMFVHGAGYLQNSHQGWSGYFREFMFHNYLTAKGYVVLDMDYRASKGYGRDWRTAIYRNMGTPELQDLKDGVEWLVANKNVDASRVGIYGGSYGGFMTFMALFKEPDLFAAGAALRPVTDWSHYNHGYTSNILNTPKLDPTAFERSSPIEFAAGLRKPLLICHGMVDNNVFFKDSVRLVQKLIELKKTKYFETAIYPVEAHGFRQPSSWLDEYTRIDRLFDRTLLN